MDGGSALAAPQQRSDEPLLTRRRRRRRRRERQAVCQMTLEPGKKYRVVAAAWRSGVQGP
jgi:hypothetical protein